VLADCIFCFCFEKYLEIGPQTTQFLLQILERELEKEPWVQYIQSIPNTRVPVMKLVSKDGNVPIDIQVLFFFLHNFYYIFNTRREFSRLSIFDM
jgi:hypothetical protein